jgi:Holliday junction resolvase RusA-like endonuclease
MFAVRGTPRPQPRPRFVRGRVVSTADPKAKLWRIAVEREAREALKNAGGAVPLFRGAVRLRCLFSFEPPASARDRIGLPHTHKPDADNLAKLVEDVMEAVGIFANDSQVAALHPEKWWGKSAGVVVVVEPMEGGRADPPTGDGEADPPSWLLGVPDCGG